MKLLIESKAHASSPQVSREQTLSALVHVLSSRMLIIAFLMPGNNSFKLFRVSALPLVHKISVGLGSRVGRKRHCHISNRTGEARAELPGLLLRVPFFL